MPFHEVVEFLLLSLKCSVQNALERFFNMKGQEISMTQQALSEARSKILFTAFVEMFKLTVNTIYKAKNKTWHGYRVSAIDGTKIALPNLPELKKYFGTIGADNSSATAQGSIMYDVLNEIIIDAQIEPLSVGERSLAKLHIESAFSENREKELIIFDRGYASYELIEELEDYGMKYLFRVKKKFNLAIDAQESSDGTVFLERDGKQIEVRVVKVRLDDGEIETLITNVFDGRLGTKAFKKLYFKRWSVEKRYDVVKNKLELENFTGHTVNAIKQDFYATMYLSNLASVLCEDSQESVEKEREGRGNKHEYQVNVNHAIGVLKDRLIAMLLKTKSEEIDAELSYIAELLQKRVCQVRPGRSVPRKKNARDAHFHHNRKSNC